MTSAQARTENASTPITRLAAAFQDGVAVSAFAYLMKKGRDPAREATNNLMDLLYEEGKAAFPKMLADAKVVHEGGMDGWLETAFKVYAADAGIRAAKRHLGEAV